MSNRCFSLRVQHHDVHCACALPLPTQKCTTKRTERKLALRTHMDPSPWNALEVARADLEKEIDVLRAKLKVSERASAGSSSI